MSPNGERKCEYFVSVLPRDCRQCAKFNGPPSVAAWCRIKLGTLSRVIEVRRGGGVRRCVNVEKVLLVLVAKKCSNLVCSVGYAF